MRFTKALKAKILAMDFVQEALLAATTLATNKSFDIGFDQGVETGREDYIPKSRALAAVETVGTAAYEVFAEQREIIHDLRDDLQALTISNVNLRFELGTALDARDEAVSKLESIKYIVAPEAFDYRLIQEVNGGFGCGEPLTSASIDYGDDEPPVQEVNDGAYDDPTAAGSVADTDAYGDPLPDDFALPLPGCLGTLYHAEAKELGYSVPDATGDTTEMSQDVAPYDARLPQYRAKGI